MSKELILEEGKYTYIQHESGGAEALRYGEHWRDLTGDKFIGAMVDRIEELERERDAFYMDYRIKCDEEAKDSALVIIERDQLRTEMNEWRGQAHRSQSDADRLKEENDRLRAHINVLREALKFLSYMAQTTGNVMGKDAGLMDGIKAAEQALATPEQPIAEYRNKVIEAFVNEFSRHVGGDGEFWLHELQDFAMNEQST